MNSPVLESYGVFAGAMMWFSSSSAVIQSIWSVTLPSTTRRYGASMKPYSLTCAYNEREPIRPMLGPSGVSIGHMRA